LVAKGLAEGLDEGARALIAEIERGGGDAVAFCQALEGQRYADLAAPLAWL